MKDSLNLLFVCSGDTCRSSMAKYIMLDKLKSKDIKHINVQSSGLFVDSKNTNITKEAKEALTLIGVKPPTKHTSSQFDEKSIDWADLIICMTYGQKKEILNNFKPNKPVYSIAEYISGVDIADPFGKDVSTYYNVARYIDFACDQILEKFLKKGDIKW